MTDPKPAAPASGDPRDLALRLLARGYHPVPIKPGTKAVRIAGWTRWCGAHPTPEEVDSWPAELFGGVGLACGSSVVVVDIDALDAMLARWIEVQARKMLGDTPLRRVGLAPKVSLYYRPRAGSAIKKRVVKLPPLDAEEALPPGAARRDQKVEVLGLGQQSVAFAIHPDAGRPYAWGSKGQGPSPLDVPAASLPEVGQEQIDAFLRAVEMIMGVGPAREAGVGEVAQPAPAKPTSPEELDQLAKDLRGALPLCKNEEREDWIRVGMALRCSGLPDDVARGLWDAWSSDPNSAGCGKYDPEDQERTWLSFASEPVDGGITVATIFGVARDGGWTRPEHRDSAEDDFRDHQVPVLDTAEPSRVAARFAEGHGTVRCWRGDFYRWADTHWRSVGDGDLEVALRTWLTMVMISTPDGETRAYQSTRRNVGDVLAALRRGVSRRRLAGDAVLDRPAGERPGSRGIQRSPPHSIER